MIIILLELSTKIISPTQASIIVSFKSQSNDKDLVDIEIQLRAKLIPESLIQYLDGLKKKFSLTKGCNFMKNDLEGTELEIKNHSLDLLKASTGWKHYDGS